MEVEVEEQVDDELGLFLLSLVQGEEVSLSLVQGEEVSLDQGEEGDCTVVDVVSTSNTLKRLKYEHSHCCWKKYSHLVFWSPDLLWFRY